MNEDEIEALITERWEAYVSQPVNFGADDSQTRMAEEDAFRAGARAMLETKIPF